MKKTFVKMSSNTSAKVCQKSYKIFIKTRCKIPGNYLFLFRQRSMKAKNLIFSKKETCSTFLNLQNLNISIQSPEDLFLWSQPRFLVFLLYYGKDPK